MLYRMISNPFLCKPMEIVLQIIETEEDETKAAYAAAECQLALSMWKEYYAKIGFHPPWCGYFIRRDDMIVGTCAFTGPPKDKRVELSYWTFGAYERQGIAGKACEKLIEIAKNAHPELVITAKTEPQKNPSVSVLEKNGFKFNAVVQDDEIGDAWEWVLNPY